MNRADILDTANNYVNHDRAADHGDAEAGFTLVATYWSAHLGFSLSAVDVSAMMALLKVARIKANPRHADNWIDGAGYLALGGEIATGGDDDKTG